MKILFCLLPYILFLVIETFEYNRQMKKGKDVFQPFQLINVAFLCGMFAYDSSGTLLTRREVSIVIGLHAVLYSVYWVVCLFIKRKYEVKMKKSNKFIVFIIMLITSIIASCIIICLALSFKIDIFIPIIMIGIGFLTGTILLIKSEKKQY